MASTTVPPPPPPGPNLNSNFCGPCPVDIGCRRRPGPAFQGSSDYVEGGEVCTDFPCPYCFEIYPISSLCPHIEDEHFFESKVAACPVCGERVHREMAAHITLRHAYLFKIQRRRKMPRASTNSSTATNINGSIDSHLQAIIGEIVSSSSRTPLSSSSIDPIVSSLMFCQNEMVNRECSNPKEGSFTRTIGSLDGSLSSEERQQRLKEAAMRAKFVQELVISTLYDS